jgi:hypothetical protein
MHHKQTLYKLVYLVRAMRQKSDDLDPMNDRLEHTSSPGELIREGHCIMILDVAVQLTKTLAIYLALKTDAAMAYQLTALD